MLILALEPDHLRTGTFEVGQKVQGTLPGDNTTWYLKLKVPGGVTT